MDKLEQNLKINSFRLKSDLWNSRGSLYGETRRVRADAFKNKDANGGVHLQLLAVTLMRDSLIKPFLQSYRDEVWNKEFI